MNYREQVRQLQTKVWELRAKPYPRGKENILSCRASLEDLQQRYGFQYDKHNPTEEMFEVSDTLTDIELTIRDLLGEFSLDLR